MSKKTKAILVRFLKGALAGAVASMAIVTVKQPSVWADFVPLLNSLGIAAGYGCIVGSLLGLQKLVSWK